MTLGLAGAASASAAITIDSPATGDYINNVKPTVQVSGATPGNRVQLDANYTMAASLVVTDPAGNLTLTPTTSILASSPEATPRMALPLTVTDTDSYDQDSVIVHFDWIPSLTGTGDDTTVAASDVTFHASSAIPDQDVRLYIDGQLADTETADGDGEVTDADGDYINMAPSNLAAGTHTAYVVSVDANGDESDESTPVTFGVQPAVPAFGALFDGIKLNHGAQNVAITDVDSSASKVTLYDVDGDGDLVELGHTTTVDALHGVARVPVTLTDGLHSLVASQTVAGVESETNMGTVAVDVKSSAPVLDDLGALIRDARPWFYATNLLNNSIANNTKVKLYVDGVAAGTDEGFGGGTDAFQPLGPIAEGHHTAYVTTIDDLGHEGTPSNTVSFTVDTVAPSLAFTAPAAGALTTATPVVALHTEPGATVRLFVDNDDLGTATADGSGDVTFTVTRALAVGSHTLVAGATDAAGNSSADVLRTVSYAAPTPAPTPVAPTPPAQPQPSPAPAPAPAPAKPVTPAAPSKVSLSSHTLTAARPVKVGFTLAKPGTVKLTLTKTVHGKTVTVATVTVKVTKAGKGSYTLKTKVGGHKLGKGRYTLTLQTVSGKKTSKKVSQALTVK